MNKKQKIHLVDILSETEDRLNKVIEDFHKTYEEGWIQRSEVYRLLQDLEEIRGKLITTDIVRMSEQLEWMGRSVKYHKYTMEDDV